MKRRLAGWQGLMGALEGAKGEAGLPVRTGIHIGDSQPTRAHGFDLMLVWVVVCLLAFGAVMVYSASIALPDSPKFARYTEGYFVMRQVLAMFVGLLAGTVLTQVPMKFWERATPWLLGLTLLLLVVVLMPGVGKGVNGARRWLPLGVMNFQPSELAKLAIALYAASYMLRKLELRESFWKSVSPMLAVLGLMGLLLLAEPDMGAFIVIAMISMGILFLGGVNGRMFLVITLVLLGSLRADHHLLEVRRERIFAYIDPWDPKYAQGKGYQLTHSLIAFGRGELFGQGLGSSVEKLHYLPEAHTDFLLAVIGEELGLVGVLAVVLAFFWMVRRIFVIGRQAIVLDRVFAGLTAQGIGLWMGGQAFINMGVNLGVLPTKGLTLPLMSYGGSAIVMCVIALAVVLRIDMENRQLMRGGRA
jgi:cell division protein FtsW